MIDNGFDPGLINLVEGGPAYGELVDPLEFLKDDPNFGIINSYGFNTRGDRLDGQQRPVLNTESDLDRIRAVGRVLELISPAAICAMGNMTNYVIGSGFSYKVMPEKDMTPPDGLVADVRRCLDCFLDDNDFVNDLDRELYRREIRDGERFVALFFDGGETQIRVVEPELVREPMNKRALEDWIGSMGMGFDGESSWSWGVHTPKDDVQTPLGYYVQWSDRADDFDYFTADDLLHVKRNVDRNVKRGISDLYPVRACLEKAEKLMTNVVEGSTIQAAIALIRKHVTGTTQAQAASFVADKSYRQYQDQTPMGQRTRNQQRYKSGTIVDSPAGQEMVPGALGQLNHPVFLEVEQAVRRFIGTRWHMPEYMMTSDASNGNFSSTLVSESPFVKYAESEQGRQKRFQLAIIWAALEAACIDGRFRQYGVDTIDDLKELIEVQAEPQMIATRDPDKETASRSILSTKGILSDATWAAQEGLDYDVEQENIKRQPVKQAINPLTGSPIVPPAPGDPPVDDPKSDPIQKAKTNVAESLGTGRRPAWKTYG